MKNNFMVHTTNESQKRLPAQNNGSDEKRHLNIKKGNLVPPPAAPRVQKEQTNSSKKMSAQKNPKLKELKLQAASYNAPKENRVQSAKSSQSARYQQ